MKNPHGVRGKFCKRAGYVTECGEETKTQQHFKDQCDINRIARNLEATGSCDHVKEAKARFGDFTEVMDVGLNMDKAARAQQLFEQTPVELRKRVGHTIQGLFEFIADEKNYDECVKWGIFEKKADQIPPAPGAPAPSANVPDQSTDKK